MKQFLCLIALAVSCLAQTAFRVDPTFVYTTPGNTPTGANAPVFAVSGSTIGVYTTQTANVLATTYTNGLGTVPCPVNAQVTLAGSGVCRSTSGPLGAFGFWLLPGQYWYTVTIGSITSIPYPLTVGGSGGGGSTSFSALTPGTNANGAMLVGAGSSIAPLSGGIVSANQINGVQLSGLATGLLKNFNGTGAPSIAGFSDVVGLWSGCSGVLYLAADGTCRPLVTSAFGRTGAVVAASGDYTASQITNVPSGNISAVTLQAAINELDSEKGAGDVVGPGSATDGCSAIYSGTTGKLIQNSPLCYDTTHNGADYLQGVSSGGTAISVPNVAGTPVTLILPIDSATATTGDVFTLGAPAACPTLLDIAKAPNNCRPVTWTAPGGGGGSPIAPRGLVPFLGIGSASLVVTVSTTAQHPLCVPLVADAAGWSLSSVSVLAQSSGADHFSAGAFDISGNLLTNGSGSTIALGGGITFNTIAFTSLTVPGGPFQLCFSSPNDVGTAAVYGAINMGVYAAAGVNAGKNSSTFSLFRAANVTTGTSTMTWPATLGTRTGATTSDDWWPFIILN